MKKIYLNDIIDYISDDVEFELLNFNKNENNHLEIKALDSINELSRNFISWSNLKNAYKIENLQNGVIITPMEVSSSNKNLTLIKVKNPRLLFTKILNKFFSNNSDHEILSNYIHPNVKIGKNVNIGYNTVIEDDVEIGDNTYIGYNNTIHSGTKIGKNVNIGSNNTIGANGFGYEKNESGDYILIKHIGNVEIGNCVDIGNNVCIDKGVLGTTIIKDGVKIDNLVHIAHSVYIGENSLIIANSMIGGSTKIGKNCWIAPSASLINKIEIGDNSIVGMSSAVIKSVESSVVVAGVPSKKIRNLK